MTRVTPTRRAVREARYQRLVQYPLFLLSLIFLMGIVLWLDRSVDNFYRTLGLWLILAGWAGFFADYLVGLVLSADRHVYVRTHVIEGLSIPLPPLRLILLPTLVRNMNAGAKNRLGGRVRLYALYLTTLVIVISSIFVLIYERSSPNGNIKTMGDAVWWAAETVSTVGYGDYYPVTIGGKLVAIVLMVNGIALLSAVTATIAARVLENDDQAADGGEAEAVITLSELNQRLRTIESQLAALTVGARAEPAVPTPPAVPTVPSMPTTPAASPSSQSAAPVQSGDQRSGGQQ